MNKGQKRTLLLLTALVVALAIALVVVNQATKPVILPPLMELQTEKITGLTYTNLYGTIDLVKTENTWKLKADSAFPVKQSQIEAMLQILATVRPARQMGDALDGQDYGLEDPQCVITVSLQDGTKEMLSIGSMNSVSDQLYVQTDTGIYLTDLSLLRAFNHSLTDIAQQAQIPKPAEGSHRRVEVENFHGRLVLSCVGSETGGTDGTWYVLTETGFVEASQEMAYNFYFLTWDMVWRSTAAYRDAGTDLAQYGLQDPQVIYTLTYEENGETKQFVLHLGSNLPDDTSYAMEKDGNLIYTMDQMLTTWLADATASLFLEG